MQSTDPTRHPSLVLVEALDLDQISGRRAFHLETLLRENVSHRVRAKAYFRLS